MNKVIEKLSNEKGVGLVSISLSTSESHSDFEQDEITYNHLLNEVKQVLEAHNYETYAKVTLNILSNVVSELDFTQLTNSLHLFVSTETIQIIKSEIPVMRNSVFIGDHFKLDLLLQEEQVAAN